MTLLCHSKGAEEANTFIEGLATIADPETIPGHLRELYDKAGAFARGMRPDPRTPAKTRYGYLDELKGSRSRGEPIDTSDLAGYLKHSLNVAPGETPDRPERLLVF